MAVDLALRVGWAYGHIGSVPAGGVWRLPDHGGQGLRYVALDNEVSRALIVFAPDLLIMATPLAMMQTSAQFLIGCCAIVEAACARESVRCVMQAESMARKAMLGCGRFRSSAHAKATVADWAQQQGYRTLNDNHADALLMWRYACQHVARQASVSMSS